MKQRTTIEVLGAKQNNLKNISVEIPRDKLTVITGVSGSGKSSLAFDVIYGEAQRRFLDSISNFAKSRIGQIKKPKVDFVNGLSPVVAIEQKKGNNNPRSTIGTVTDINDYLRLLFATAGVGGCPVCGCELSQFSAAQMAERISSLKEGTVVRLSAPVYKIYGEDYSFLFTKIREKGYKKLLLNGQIYDLSDKEEIDLDEADECVMEIIIDTFTIKPDIYIQIAKTIEAAMIALDEDLFIKIEIDGQISQNVLEKFYTGFACPEHHFALCEMQPFHFSFNAPASACNTCAGLGTSHVAEPRYLVVNPNKGIMKGALNKRLFNPTNKDNHMVARVYTLSQHFGFNLETPFCELSEEIRNILFFGSPEKMTILQPPFASKKCWVVGRVRSFPGFVNMVQSWYRNYMRRSVSTEVIEPDFINDTMIERICPECNGARLKKQRLAIKVNGYDIDTLSRMQIPELQEALQSLEFKPHKVDVGKSIVTEINKRLQLLADVGLYYLSISRRSDSVSGGEMQRIKMSTQISSELMGMLYVMDEPSIGLHSRDSQRVIDIMKRLRDIGNTVIVVEHDLETMRNADYLIEIGPGPGIHGGSVTADGSYAKFIKTKTSVTADYLSGRQKIAVPESRRKPGELEITIQGARANNLKNITVEIPLGLFVCVTGVSGSGKSTLINEVLFKHMEVLKKQARIQPGDADYVFGYDQISNVINIDQSPIGRGSKSNPATYVGVYDRIRKLFAETEEAVTRGYTALDFSLTHANGCRCEHCTGDGVIVTNLQYMADIEVPCPVCKGLRFSEEGTEIKYNGKSIADVLDMTVEEAMIHFEDDNYLSHKLTIMNDLGLGYLKLGQRSTTLSGGEAQRIKLSYELSKIKRGNSNLYILDEPTTGLHMLDIQRLLDSIGRIVDSGHTVLVIEHNIDVIKCADYLIDMGPEGGKGGGFVVAKGTPEQVAECEQSHTGAFLKKELKRV